MTYISDLSQELKAASASAYRAAVVGHECLYATDLPPGSQLVRVCPETSFAYDRMIVVTERDGGRELFLQGWIGEPLSLDQWRTARATLFPAAQVITWERREDDGTVRHIRVSI